MLRIIRMTVAHRSLKDIQEHILESYWRKENEKSGPTFHWKLTSSGYGTLYWKVTEYNLNIERRNLVSEIL